MINAKESYNLYNNTCFISETLKQMKPDTLNYGASKYGRQVFNTFLRTPALIDLLNLSIGIYNCRYHIMNGNNDVCYSVKSLYKLINPLLSDGRYGLTVKASHLAKQAVKYHEHYQKTTSIPKEYYLD